MWNNVKRLAIALGVLALLFFAFGWNLPVTSSCSPNNNPHENATTNKADQNSCPLVGTIVRGFISSGWDFAVDNHIFDAVIAAFTLLLASFTGFLWKATAGLLKHTPQIERAYISGGGVPLTQVVEYTASIVSSSPGRGAGIMHTPTRRPTDQFELHINNHGKTPGELTEIGIGFCEAMEIPEKPDYTRHYFQDWIGPGTQSRPIHRIAIPAILSYPAIYGRFYYRDIFGNSHSAGFILAIDQTGSLPVLAPQEYTASD
jgi:hypothetical protein